MGLFLTLSRCTARILPDSMNGNVCQSMCLVHSIEHVSLLLAIFRSPNAAAALSSYILMTKVAAATELITKIGTRRFLGPCSVHAHLVDRGGYVTEADDRQ